MARRARDQFGPRIRFNWGYHDGARDYLDGRPDRRYLTHQERSRAHPLPKGDAPYVAGYGMGHDDAEQGQYTGTSTDAWRRHQGENPRRVHRPKVWAGERDEFFVETWEERDRLHIALYFDPEHGRQRRRDRRPGDGDLVAEWWDDDAREMFEDGFFKSGRALEDSVVDYAESVALVKLT